MEDKPIVEEQAEGFPTIPGGEYGLESKPLRRDRFTAEMKDRQARGKDWMTGTKSDDENERGDGKGSAKIEYTGDGYEAVERRRKAMAILDSRELLAMYAQERGDSIASARYHLQHVVCGIEDTRKPFKQRSVVKSTPKKPMHGVLPEFGNLKLGDQRNLG